MDSFIGKDSRVDSVRTVRPNKSPRVTREDGSHGNKEEYHPDHEEPKDQVDIHAGEEIDNTGDHTSNPKTTAHISLKTIRDAMVAQARQSSLPEEADPAYRKALSAYKSYLSQTTLVPELQETDERGRKTQFGKLNDLIRHGVDQVSIERGQSYDDLVTDLWDQTFVTK